MVIDIHDPATAHGHDGNAVRGEIHQKPIARVHFALRFIIPLQRDLSVEDLLLHLDDGALVPTEHQQGFFILQPVQGISYRIVVFCLRQMDQFHPVECVRRTPGHVVQDLARAFLELLKGFGVDEV